ncbi:MAG: hypothetical protein AAF549_00335 [Pseudomonadota bacterium]
MIDTEFDLKELPKTAIKKIKAVCKGNGAKAPEIVVTGAKGKIIECQPITRLNIEPVLEQKTKNGRHQVGEYIEDRSQLQKILHDMTASVMKNDESRKFLSKKLLDRADKGFGLQGETFEIEQFHKSFYTLEPCHSCQGIGNTVCSGCQGQRKEVCNHCQGSGQVPCDYCNSTGTMKGPGGNEQQCNRCFGRRVTGCTTCQRTGHISCRQCSGSGTRTCQGCNGAAFKTHLADLSIQIKTAFEIDRAELPPSAVQMLEKEGPRLAEKQHIKMQAEPVKLDDGALGIEYKTSFPLINMQFRIKKRDYKADLFGYKAKFVYLPPILEHLLRNPFDKLQNATQIAAKSQKYLNDLIRVRFFADAIMLTSQMPAKKAMQGLMRRYPFGAGKTYIRDTIGLTKKALNNATRTARWTAYGVGGLVTAALCGLYFIGPLRSATGLGQPVIIVTDILLIPIGAGLCYLMCYLLCGQFIKGLISRIDPSLSSKKKRIRIDILPCFGIAFGAFMITALLSVLIFNVKLFWLPL